MKPSTTHALRRALTALAALAVLGSAGTLTSQTASAATDDVLSGVYVGAADVTEAREFGDWRGREVEIVQDFVDAESWSSIANPTWAADRWKNTDYVVAWSVPMLPASGGSIQGGARGDYNAHFKSLASTLVDRGLGDSVIRLGWEMNGTWFRWSAVKDPAAFNRYWRQIVDSMRSVKGASFQFEWSPNVGEGTAGFDKERAYPGDAYVDLIGSSMYDQSWAYPSKEVAKRWNGLVTTEGGLQWQVDFAKAHGKRNTLPEWGLSDRCDGFGGYDNPYYIEQVAAWVAKHDFYYETYFDYKTHDCEQHSITQGDFPKARSAYKKLFGAGAGAKSERSPVQPVVSTPAASADGVDESVVRVSWSSDRSGAQELEWMGVSTDVYIFATPSFAVDRVRYYLDDPGMRRAPLAVEMRAPYDLAGGSAGTATAFDAAALSVGKHTLTVVFETPSGDRTTTVDFLR